MEPLLLWRGALKSWVGTIFKFRAYKDWYVKPLDRINFQKNGRPAAYNLRNWDYSGGS
jgi:hypothetical protein